MGPNSYTAGWLRSKEESVKGISSRLAIQSCIPFHLDVHQRNLYTTFHHVTRFLLLHLDILLQFQRQVYFWVLQLLLLHIPRRLLCILCFEALPTPAHHFPYS